MVQRRQRRWWGGRRQARRAGPAGVLIIVQNLSVPTDRRVWMECLALVEAGYRVSVIAPRGERQRRRLDVDGVHIRTYRPPPGSAGAASYLAEFVYCWLRTAVLAVQVGLTRGFTVVQACNPPDTYWLLALLMRPFGVRFVYDQHDLCPEIYEARFGRRGPMHRALVLLERATYATADHVVSTNTSYREIALQRGSVRPADVSVVMSAPDPMRLSRVQADPALRRGRDHLVVYLGIMGPQDGVGQLLEAIAVYVHEMARTDCHFALLGFGDSLAELRARSDHLKLQGFVEFTGRVELPEISTWLSSADLGVTPDPRNPFNDRSTMNKTLEYMAFGLPVVAADLLETRRSAGAAAVYVDGGARDFAKELAALLDNPFAREQMGALARQRIVKELCWQQQAPAYVAVFDRLTRAGSAET